MKHIYKPWIILILIAAILLICTGCQPSAEPVDGQETTSETVTAFTGDLSASTGATGKVIAVRTAKVTFTSSGTVAGLPVTVGDKVVVGDMLVQLDKVELNRAATQAEQNVLSLMAALANLKKPPTLAELTAAETAVSASQTRLDKLNNGPTANEIAAAEANVRAAEANVWAAANRHNATKDGAAEADVLAAQMEVDTAQRQFDDAHSAYIAFSKCQPNDSGTHDCTFDRGKQGSDNILFGAAAAQANLDRAQAILNTLQNGNPHSIAVAQASVSVAAAQRDAALARLDLLLAGATDAEIAAAAAELAQAKARLIDLQDGPKPEQVTVATAQLEQAKLALAQAQHNLEHAALVAPFAGMVTAVHVRKGEQATGPAITLVDTESILLALKINEIDLRHITLGQTAEVRLEAWPEQPLTGTITMISPENQPQETNNAIVYIVHLQLAATDLQLRLGMTGNADLITAERKDVLLLPNRALTTNLETGESLGNLVQTG
ncbi:MAG: HlyD family efflux transporter periplasmic adaptor subunit, partial [Chloroflexi bacterium]